MAQLDPQRRPHYPSTERMAILQLRAVRAWSLEQTVKVFLVTADTIGSWTKRINHVWHVDLTLVPTRWGFWASWLPYSLLQCWPFGYWVAVVIDHFSRRAMGFAVFQNTPASRDARSFLGRLIHQAQATPKCLICDKGKQFWCQGFNAWCKRKDIRPRFGATGQHGSIAVVERFIQTVKVECTRKLLVSLRPQTFGQELAWFSVWYNERRPHTTLGGGTPDEVYFRQRPANRSPRFEPSCSLASVCPLCLASGAGQGPAGSASRTGGMLPAWTQASAGRGHPTGRVKIRSTNCPRPGLTISPILAEACVRLFS